MVQKKTDAASAYRTTTLGDGGGRGRVRRRGMKERTRDVREGSSTACFVLGVFYDLVVDDESFD